MNMNLRKHFNDTSLPVFIAVLVFAIASWIDINGVFVEFPLMVNVLPEGWNLPSYLVIIIQLANVGPLAFTIAKKLAPKKVHEWWVIYVIIGTGMVSCLFLTFFWKETSYIGGVLRSTPLLVLSMFLALVDCTSSVVFLPYMAQYSAQYLNALYVGEGLSGLIPGIIGMIQGVGKDPVCVNSSSSDSNGTEFVLIPVYEPPLFSVNVFFGILCILLFLSGFAFTLLHFHPKFTVHKVSQIAITATDEEDSQGGKSPKDGSLSDASLVRFNCHDGSTTFEDGHNKNVLPNDDPIVSIAPGKPDSPPTFSVFNRDTVVQLVLIGWLNALTNGVLPSIQSYSCLPYGNLAYNLAVRLSILVNPIACFFGFFVKITSTIAFVVLVLIGTAFSAYHIAMAAMSPYPPLYDHMVGIVLVVSTFVLLTAIFSYVKMSIAIVLSHSAGAKGLLWCGGVTQLGSCIGAIVIFILVNVVKLFGSKNSCT